MSGTNDQRRDWIRRVLGGEIGASGGKPSLAEAIAAWQRALESIEGQIAALQQVLRASPDPELKEIAEFGLGAMTGSHKVKIQAALVEGPRMRKHPLLAADQEHDRARELPRGTNMVRSVSH